MSEALFLITSVPEGFNGEQVVSTMSGWPYRIIRRIIEANTSNSTASTDEQSSTTTEQLEQQEKEQFKEKFRTHKVLADTVDHYEALGLAHIRWSATQQQIRTAFRKMSLQYHPDKLISENGIQQADDSRILKAYEILSDPKKRREYDSTDVFDDHIPTESEADNSLSEKQFYELFRAVFDRNSRFSVAKNVPRFGDDNTPFKEVEKFYEFWFSFKSWREFPLEDAYDPAEAESREERRWIIRQNEKQKLKKKNEEHARILKLAELAYKKDPRINRRKEEERNAKELKKAKKREEIEQRIKAEQEEKERELRKKEEEIEKARRKKEEEEKVIVERRKTLLKLMNEHENEIGGDMRTKAEILESRLSSVKFADLVNSILKEPDKTKEIVLGEFSCFEEQDKKRKEKEEEDQRKRHEVELATIAAKKARPNWTEHELSLLARAVKKFPPGVHERWEKISQMVGSRTPDEIIEKTQEIKMKDVRVVQKEDPYLKMKETVSDRPIDSPLDLAWDRLNETSTEKQKQQAKTTNSTTMTTTTTTTTTTTAIATSSSPQQQKPTKTEKPKTIPTSTATSASADNWTAEQQKLLEQGLRTHKGKDRWDRISEMIPGKTKDDCLKRFNFLKQVLSQQKTQGTTSPSPQPQQQQQQQQTKKK